MAQFSNHPYSSSTIFIGSYPDGQQRSSRSKSAGENNHGSHWHKLPTDPWLRSLLCTELGNGADIKLLSSLNPSERSNSATRLSIHCIASISNHKCRWVDDTNISGLFGKESITQLAYYNGPLDAYEVHVEWCKNLKQPEPIIGRRANRARDQGFKQASPFNPLFMPHWGSRDPNALDWESRGGGAAAPASPRSGGSAINSDGEEDALAEDIERENSDLDLDIDVADDGLGNDVRGDGLGKDVCDDPLEYEIPADGRRERFELQNCPCLLLPEAIVQLMERNQWTKLVLLTRWHPVLFDHLDGRRRVQIPGPISGWPSPVAPVWEFSGKHRESDNIAGALPFNAETCRSFAEDLGEFAPRLLEGARGDAEQERLRATLERMHASLHTWMNAFGHKAPRAKFQHDSRTLLQAIKQSSLLKGGAKKLCESIARSLAMALPKIMQDEFLRSVSEDGDEFKEIYLNDKLEKEMPSSTLTRRYERLYL